MNFIKKPIGYILLIISLTALAYLNSLHAQFQFDDFHQIVRNDGIKSISNIPKFFVSIGLISQHQWGRGYRPLTHSSFALNYAVSGNDPWSFHAFNLLLHIINSLLVYIIIKRILSAGREGVSQEEMLPWAVALIFALHPVQTNAVTYISGRALLLAAAFGLFSFYSFLRYRESESGALWAGTTVVSFMFALLSKEIAICFPALMLLYVVIFPQRGKQAKSSFRVFVSLALALVVYLSARKFLTGFVTAPSAAYGRLEYMLSEAKATILYLKLILLPINQNADYNLPLTKSLDADAALSILVIMGLSATLLMLRRRMPLITFFGLWWLVALAPEALIVPITDIAVEYRMYIPSIGFIAASMILVDRLIKNTATLRALIITVTLLLGVLTVERNEVWATQRTFWADVMKKTSGSIRAHANYGNALYGEGLYKEAVVELMHAISLDPFNSDQAYTYNNLGLCYMRLELAAEAEESFKRSLTLEPEIEEPYINLSVLYHRQGRYVEEAEVLRKLLKAIPRSAVGRRNLAAAEEIMTSKKPYFP